MLDVVVFASGRGTNFAALLDAQRRGELAIRIRALLSDMSQAHALALARAADIDAIALAPADYPDRAAFDRALFAHVVEYQPGLIVLAGYLRVIDTAVVDAWRGRIINIHPSLLPKYPGLHTHRRALEAGDTTHGASVHYVTAQLDGGPVIAQVEMLVHAGDTPRSLAARLLPLEHRLLIASVDRIARGRIALRGNHVECDGIVPAAPLRMNAQGKLEAVG
ncbi:MAG: phosphoribosylglycinamide formyltransferase [Rudaea sp.]